MSASYAVLADVLSHRKAQGAHPCREFRSSLLLMEREFRVLMKFSSPYNQLRFDCFYFLLYAALKFGNILRVR